MKVFDRISGMISRYVPKFSLTDIIDINEQPLFKMPNYMFRMKYWLGALVAAALSFEVFSGLFLLLTYYPSDPYNQTMFLVKDIPFGAPILFSHMYGAYFMIFLIYLHLFRNYFDGAYKKPRQFLWVVGLVLFAITLATAFTGYSLPADILGVDADGVANGILSYLPGGSILQVIVFGNGLPLDMYTRLLAWHIILTAMIGAFFVIHFLLFEQYGVMPSKKVRDRVPAVYSKEEWKDFNPWWPRNFLYTLSLTLMIWGFILIVPNVLANLNGVPFILQPAPAPSPSSPLALTVPPYPPWFFLFLYKALDFYTPTGAAYNPLVASTLAAAIPALYLLALPWLDSSEETEPRKRPLWVGIGILLITYLIQLSIWAYTAPGVSESFSLQTSIMLPPLVLTFLCIYLMPRFHERKKGELILKPRTAALLIVLGLTIVGTLPGFFNSPVIYVMGILIPLCFSYAMFGRRVDSPPHSWSTDEAVHRRRPVWAGIGILLITYLVQFSVWAYTTGGRPEPLNYQIGIMLPPLVLAFICIYLIPRLADRTEGRLKLTPKTAVLLIVVGLVFAGTLSSFLSSPTIYGLGIVIPIGLSYALFGRRIARGTASAGGKADAEQSNTNIHGRRSAILLMFVLLILAFVILGLMLLVPITGQASTYWGIGTGIEFLIFSYGLNLYDNLYYPQEDDEFRLPPAETGAGTVYAPEENSGSAVEISVVRLEAGSVSESATGAAAEWHNA